MTKTRKTDKHLVLIGGGHAHMETLLRLEDFRGQGHKVTVISTADYQYYSAMGTGLLGGLYQPQETRFHIRRMVEERGGAFLRDEVVAVDPENRLLRLSSGRILPYDLASFNIGSEPDAGGLRIDCDRVLPVKPIRKLFQARLLLQAVQQSTPLRLLVAGGGPSGVEIAANLRRLLPDAGITLIAGRGLLTGLPGRMAAAARRSLTRHAISCRENCRVLSLQHRKASLDDGSMLPYDLAFLAIGLKPPALFGASGLATGRGNGLLVDSCLRSVSHPELFGGGDCIDFQPRELARVGVYAVRQGPLLHRNLLAALNGSGLLPFKPQKSFLLILNLGDATGLLGKGRLVWHGRLALLLKDHIDRRFMKKYQVSGERTEPWTADSLLQPAETLLTGQG
jgi:NADH dehydrogenase FAD-containing subunit